MTKEENIATVLGIAERLPTTEKLALIGELLSMIDQTTLSLITRSLEANIPDEDEL